MLKVGLIGYGYWGPNFVRNFATLSNAKITHVCDSSKQRLEVLKQNNPDIKTTTNYKSMIKNAGLDAVIITTPPPTHFKIAKAALENNLHILISKPMTLKTSHSKILHDLAKEKNLKVVVDSTFLYTGAINKIKDIIAKGELGNIYFINSRRLNFGLFQPGEMNAAWDLSPHDVAISMYLLNKPVKSVQCIGYPHVFKNVEDNVYLFLKFQDNTVAHIHNNWLSPIKARDMIIVGTKKMLSYDMTQPKQVQIYNKSLDVKKYPLDTTRDIEYKDAGIVDVELENVEALKKECEHFVDCILNNKEPITSAKHGLDVVRVLQAAQKSIKKNGKEILLDDN